MESWVKAVSRASFDYMRLVVRELERQLEETQEGSGGLQGRPKSSKRLWGWHAPNQEHYPVLPWCPLHRLQGETHARSLQEEGQLLSGASKESKPSALIYGCAEGPPSGVPWEGNGNGNGGGDVVRPPPVPPLSFASPNFTTGTEKRWLN
ncbi:unnamed protein product, partial [Coregonus sp. 'balchen']